jgi:hypothetical protein
MNTGNDKPSFHLARVSGNEELYEQTEIIMLNDAPPGGAGVSGRLRQEGNHYRRR